MGKSFFFFCCGDDPYREAPPHLQDYPGPEEHQQDVYKGLKVASTPQLKCACCHLLVIVLIWWQFLLWDRRWVPRLREHTKSLLLVWPLCRGLCPMLRRMYVKQACFSKTFLPYQVLLFLSTHQTVLKLHEALQVLKKNKKDMPKIPSSSESNRAAVNFWLSFQKNQH